MLAFAKAVLWLQKGARPDALAHPQWWVVRVTETTVEAVEAAGFVGLKISVRRQSGQCGGGNTPIMSAFGC